MVNKPKKKWLREKKSSKEIGVEYSCQDGWINLKFPNKKFKNKKKYDRKSKDNKGDLDE